MSTALLPTAFHVRTAEYNAANAWVGRGRFTVAARFTETRREALAARFSCVLADMSPLEDLHISGSGAGALLAAACGSSLRSLGLRRSRAIHWCSDGGGLRGAGQIIRTGESEFTLRSADCDFGWFATAAPRFGATLRDATVERGLLLLAGPFAGAVLAAAGMDQARAIEPDQHAALDWRGLRVVVGRDARLNGFLISCAAEDGVLVFCRLLRAGLPLGLRLAGQDALELLQLEAGLALPHLDYQPARGNFSDVPLPSALGSGSMKGASRVLMGIEFDSEEPRSFISLYRGEIEAGCTMRSAYSLALRRAIALAQLDLAHASPGTMLNARRGIDGAQTVAARVVTLPFL